MHGKTQHVSVRRRKQQTHGVMITAGVMSDHFTVLLSSALLCNTMR